MSHASIVCIIYNKHYSVYNRFLPLACNKKRPFSLLGLRDDNNIVFPPKFIYPL